MIKIATTIAYLSLLVQLSTQDTYMQNPRGSNDRLNSKGANRKNGARLFDSQNNAKGGYNVGVINEDNQQYQMKYYAGSKLRIEWTHQHGCGFTEDGTTQINCNVILSYMCQKTDDPTIDPITEKIRDGETETTINPDAPTENEGLQEPVSWYKDCKNRQRNKGLFTADQNMRGRERGVHTRQNRNGNRRGLECAEERDYWPYWHSSPWNDISYIASNHSCPDMTDSSNVVARQVCASFDRNGYKNVDAPLANNEEACKQVELHDWINTYQYTEKLTKYTNARVCAKNGGQWGIPWDFKQSKGECLRMPAQPECVRAQNTRENHLGNHMEDENDGSSSYDWKLPTFADDQARTCVLRLRYNISSDSYPATADVNDNNNGIIGNPTVGIARIGLKLNLNTAQVGRTFQDRSHAFQILPRIGSGLKDSDNVYNLNVRGKRGNIVQTFPATEYDFVPQHVGLNSSNDVVHIQWTGSETNNQGDDKNNFLMTTLNSDFPIDFVKTSFLDRIQEFKYLDRDTGKTLPNKFTKNDLAIYLATSGFYKTLADIDGTLETRLENASPSFPGAWIRFKSGGVERYNTFCSVNNNFSNRRQLGVIDLLF